MATKQATPPTVKEVREWAMGRPDLQVSKTGSLPQKVIIAWNKTHKRKYGMDA